MGEKINPRIYTLMTTLSPHSRTQIAMKRNRVQYSEVAHSLVYKNSGL
ncbi:hypothetical protein J5U22_01474 [Saccharolobus shibatae]|uniref:Uncharacterized protein n=1 Tax=Saccharolobus shibatae TaxID=2286 RepID=A0A8F5C0K8_9CREN|nr:hypothetical protein J5U22_01474 [Saccharolobus shibatae]